MTGTPIKPGYQSHYCLVKSNGQPYSNELGDTFFDELVLAQDVQILPKYIVYLTKNRANGSDEQQDSINNANCENQSKRPIWGADASLNGVLEAADNHNEERKQEIDEKDEQKRKKIELPRSQGVEVDSHSDSTDEYSLTRSSESDSEAEGKPSINTEVIHAKACPHIKRPYLPNMEKENEDDTVI